MRMSIHGIWVLAIKKVVALERFERPPVPVPRIFRDSSTAEPYRASFSFSLFGHQGFKFFQNGVVGLNRALKLIAAIIA
jgi:hypothetical protein